MSGPGLLLFGARRRVFFTERLRTACRELLPGARLIGCDSDELDPLRFFLDDFFVFDDAAPGAFEHALLDECRRRGVTMIVPWNDQHIRALDAVRDRYERAGVHLAILSGPAVQLCCDKRRTAEWALAHEIPHPRLVEPDRPLEHPLIVKPRYGQGSVGVSRVTTRAELDAALATAASEVIVQEYYPGTEYTVDVGLRGDGELVFAVPRRRLKTRGGEVLIARVELRPAIVELVARICRHLPGAGILNVQVIDGADGLKLLEMNPRFGGGTDLSIRAGADVPRYLLEQLVHGRIVSPAPAIVDRLVLTRYLAPVFFEDTDGRRHIELPTHL